MEMIQKKNNTLSKDQKTQNRMKRKPMFDQSGTTLLNGVKLSFQRGFGFQQNHELNSPAHCIDDNKVVYLLGKQIIQYDMLTENQKVIGQIDQQQEITSFIYFKNLMLDDNIMYSVYANNKTYPSIIGKNYSKNMTQKYVMSHLEKEEKVLSILLIAQNKYLVALSELQGTYRLSYTDVQSKEVLASQSVYFKVLGMFIPEAYPKCIMLYTANQLYLVTFGVQIKPISLGLTKFLSQINGQQIVQAISSVFTTNDILVYLITNRGNLMFVSINVGLMKVSNVESLFLGEFQTLDENGNEVAQHRLPSSICCNEYSILIGYHYIEQFSLVKICPIMTSKPTTHKIAFSCPNLHKIVRMQFAHQTMSICVIVQVKQNDRFDLTIPIQSQYLKQKGEQASNKQSLSNHSLKPGKTFPVIFNMLLHDTLVQTLRSPIQSILGWMMFVKEILDIAILPTKKIMLILSKERKIKAVKYEHLNSTSFQRMLIWQMHFNQNDWPTALDVHPLTFNVAVGFKEGLKLFTLSSQGLKPNNIQFPLKNCQSVRYSKFGHKLIAGSSNQILIISPYENKILQTIPLNSGYNIKQIQFIDRDIYIFSQYSNGSAMIMNADGGKMFEVWKKELKTVCAVYDSIFDIMAVSYTDNFTKFYRERGTQDFGILWTHPFNITKMLIVNELGTIFMGTSLGKIRAYQWPYTDGMRFNKSYTEIQLHSSPITRLKIIHDYSLLISGAEDGTIFISKINAYSDGIAITDAQIMHSLKSSNKNYTNLFYLQNYMITSSAIQFGQQQMIVQLQSDKADFQTEQGEQIVTMQHSNQQKLRKEQKERQSQFKQKLQGRQLQIQDLNEKKIQIRDKINDILKKKARESEEMETEKLKQMRSLYKQTDNLKEEQQKLLQKFRQQINKLREENRRAHEKYLKQLREKQGDVLKDISVVQKDHNQAIINYQQLIKEENQEGLIYKNRMLEEMNQQFLNEKSLGEKLRADYNVIRHKNVTIQQKFKNFQQMITQMQIDIQSNNDRSQQLKTQQEYLQSVLVEKDKIILDEQKSVKQLLSKNINNYTHQEYLKHKQEQLLDKVRYLENEIGELENKYNNFQLDFVQVTNQSGDLKTDIENAIITIQELKEKDKILKEKLYLKNYKNKELFNVVEQAFHQCECDKSHFLQELQSIFANMQPSSTSLSQVKKPSTSSLLSSSPSTFALTSTPSALFSLQQSAEDKINKRDHLIKQVVNTNKLRKIDDSIRRTIMIKLNRETVSLTCQVNELRKQKKKLGMKAKELKYYIEQLEQLTEGSKENKKQPANKGNKSNSRTDESVMQEDIVPANISIIRPKPSKHIPSSMSGREKLLPFQLYHQNKQQSKHSLHYQNRSFVKDHFDESSTQLPSILPSILKNNSISQETSRMFNGVQTQGDSII